MNFQHLIPISPLSTSLKAHFQLLRLHTPSSLPFSLSGPLSQEYFLWLSLAVFSAFIQLAKIPFNDMAVLSRLVLALDLAPSLNHPLVWYLFPIKFPANLTFPWTLYLPGVSLPIQVSLTSAKSILSDWLNIWFVVDWLVDLSLKKKVVPNSLFFSASFFSAIFFCWRVPAHPSPTGLPPAPRFSKLPQPTAPKQSNNLPNKLHNRVATLIAVLTCLAVSKFNFSTQKLKK